MNRGLLQREVAALLSVSPWTVLNWETAATTPQTNDGPAIVRFLGFLPLLTKTLAEKLYAVRFVNGWTQAQAGQAAGVSEDGWSVWEAGAAPTKRVLDRLRPMLARLPAKPNV